MSEPTAASGTVRTWHKGAEGAEHGPPGVQQLQLEVAVELALLHSKPGSAEACAGLFGSRDSIIGVRIRKRLDFTKSGNRCGISKSVPCLPQPRATSSQFGGGYVAKDSDVSARVEAVVAGRFPCQVLRVVEGQRDPATWAAPRRTIGCASPETPLCGLSRGQQYAELSVDAHGSGY